MEELHSIEKCLRQSSLFFRLTDLLVGTWKSPITPSVEGARMLIDCLALVNFGNCFLRHMNIGNIRRKTFSFAKAGDVPG